MNFLSFVNSIDKKLEGVSINDRSKVINGTIATTYGLTTKLLGEKVAIVMDSDEYNDKANQEFDSFLKNNGIEVVEKDFEERIELPITLRENNSVSSFEYIEIKIENKYFMVAVYSLLNTNWTSNNYIDFSTIVPKDKFVMPIGKVLSPFFEPRYIIDDIYINKIKLEEDQSKGIDLDGSINYFVYHLLGEDCYVASGSVEYTKGVVLDLIPEYISREKIENENAFLLHQGDFKYKVNSVIHNNKELLDFNTMIKL